MAKVRFVFLFLVCVLHASKEISAAQILAVIPFDMMSHYLFCQPILRELANRGHQVTVLTSIQDPDPPKNYHQILIPGKKIFEVLADGQDDLFKGEPMSLYTEQVRLWNSTIQLTEHVLSSKEFQGFIANDKNRYDLIIYEIFYQEALLTLASIHKAPIVGLSTFGHGHFINQFMGNPYELSYSSHEFLGYCGKLKFIDRIKNFFWIYADLFEMNRYLLSEQNELVNKYFHNTPSDRDSVQVIQNNVSLVLVNSHFSINGVRPNVPGIVEIGGIHIKEPKKLPQELQTFLDGASEGAIYFSLGSTVTSTSLPEENVQHFLRVFAGLKQRVVWKWDEGNLKGKPDNVLILKWLPQSDVLAHPNMRLFINQAGSLSMQEAISRSIPIVCIPLYGDQYGNCERAKLLGYGERLDPKALAEDVIREAVTKVLQQPSYKETAKKYSILFNDRPMTALETAVYWIEYVIRHKGAPQMKSPAKDLNWIQYYSIDVISCLALIIYSIYQILWWAFWNVALRKKIPRDDLKHLIELNQPKKKMKSL